MTQMIALTDETYNKLKEIKTGSFDNTVKKLIQAKPTIEVRFEDIEFEVRKAIREEIEKARAAYQ